MQIFALFSFAAIFSGLFYIFTPQRTIDSPGLWLLLARRAASKRVGIEVTQTSS